jgi:hypothetical protein
MRSARKQGWLGNLNHDHLALSGAQPQGSKPNALTDRHLCAPEPRTAALWAQRGKWSQRQPENAVILAV